MYDILGGGGGVSTFVCNNKLVQVRIQALSSSFREQGLGLWCLMPLSTIF